MFGTVPCIKTLGMRTLEGKGIFLVNVSKCVCCKLPVIRYFKDFILWTVVLQMNLEICCLAKDYNQFCLKAVVL